VKYEWARDTNVMNLRFFSYLMMEEIETIIDNMDETRGMNYLNSVDAKLQKRNNIINHLLREKAVTAKLMTKILAIMENTSTDSQDLTHMITSLDLPKSAPKSRILSKLQNI
jgi:glycerol uptake facilitator-like aquaporin